MTSTSHRPVLLPAVLEFLAVRPGGVYVDATLGGGGYAAGILAAGAGEVLGLDWDDEALARAGEALSPFGGRIRLFRRGFQELLAVLAEAGRAAVDGVAADLGLSSDHLAAAERGFSFQSDGPLDMRMDRRGETTAAGILAEASEAELKRIIREFGEEPAAGRIAKAIVARRAMRPVETTADLARIAAQAGGGAGRRTRIHPATRTFQALRIAVNREMDNLPAFLAQLPAALKTGGRAVVVAYHSLEDRRVKQSFREMARGCLCPPGRPCVCGRKPVFRVLTPRPVAPSEDEAAQNPRARSARLRAAERL